MTYLDRRSAAFLSAWFPFAVIVTVLCGFMYVAIQQEERLSANDPQIQLAEELSSYPAPASAITDDGANLATTQAPFAVAYDETGTPAASSGKLDGAAPRIPAGIFDYVRAHGEDRVTWQPRPGLRFAAVVIQASKPGQGFVLAARSLRETEEREGALTAQAFIAWLVAMAMTGAWAWRTAAQRLAVAS